MIRNGFQLARAVSFGAVALCAPGCGGDGARTPVAVAGQGGASASAGGGWSGAATAGISNGAGEAGAALGAGTGGATNTGGAAGTSSGAGSPGIGGSASAGAPAAAGGGGAGSACHARAGLLACDDFEVAAVGAVPGAPWSAVVNGEGSVAVDDTVPAHSGSKSVHVHGSGYQTLLVYHDPARLPQASGRFYVRAFVRLAEAMTGGHNTFVLADTFAAPNAGNALRLGEQNAMLMMTVGGDAHGFLSNQNYYNDHLPGVTFKPGVYSCLELLLDSAHTEIRVWVDGVDVPDLHVTNLAHENYDALRFGFEKYAGPESDIWYDDIAIGSERIGCD
ncbi:MAG TPA: hypothetical protein VER12_01810 [Polyangiaceae bacterium]|nr:hypothetical protein [Polyangiaceae bacterium]